MARRTREEGGKITIGGKTEEEVAFETLFPYSSRYQLLQMTTRFSNREIPLVAIVGVLRRIFGLKSLEVYQEELMVDKISSDGLGRAEGAEIVAAVRAKREVEEE